ncbi:MAG: endolytic transglycosylase MltG [Candidatus Eremiobacterota bacterium]
MKALLQLFRVGCFIFVVAAGLLLWWTYQAVSPAATEPVDPVIVEIPPGATGADVALLLESKGVIRSAFALRMLMRISERGGEIRSGHYRVDPNDSPVVVLKSLVEGRPLTRRFTVPEGYTLAQIAQVLAGDGLADEAEFLALARTKGRSFDPSLPDNLEGYLFPDTYEVAWEADERAIIGQMLARFREVATPMWEQHRKKSTLDLNRTVILASLVEREASVPGERPLIAGVYLNRLKKGMLLQCDATIQYALGQPKKVLTYADLELESPYNTYKHPDLPPGPIANPGRASLEAAMNPEPSQYLFYVRNDVKNDGSHVFSRDYAEHQDAIDRVQR